MEASFFTQVLLPGSLALIMFGMGLSLTLNDFKRLMRTPKAVSLGLFGQMICLPLVTFTLCVALDVAPHIAIGLMVLAACPGGTQNATMSILIAVSFLQHPEYAIASGVYGVTMYVGAFILIMSRKLGWFGFTPKVS